MTSDSVSVARPRVLRNPLLRLLASIWLGVALLALILVYSSVISALPPVRQAFEMTEMQAFRHWVFVGPVALLMVTLAVATLLRTRWQAVNLGALTAHVGMLLLLGGAWAYFGMKVEGNLLLQAPAIEVRATIGDRSAVIGELPAAPGEAWARKLPHTNQPLTIRVLGVSGAAGAGVAQARVAVQLADGPPQEYALGAGDERAQQVHEFIAVRLRAQEAQSVFYDQEAPALYCRHLADGREEMAVIRGLPIYHERCRPGDEPLRDTRGDVVKLGRAEPRLDLFGVGIPTGWFEPWRMPISVDASLLPFTVQITGYLPYVVMLQPRDSADPHSPLEPVLAARAQRRTDLSPRAMSAIRLELRGRGEYASWEHTTWCLFSAYPDAEARPVRVTIPGLDFPWEIVYSRQRHDLGASVVARDLHVEYFPGQRGVESYYSAIAITPAGGGAAQPALVETNHTVTVGRWTLFQSLFSEDHWSYSVLGVGNRVGISAMNAGWVLVTLGCLYAFYVKPVLLRRMARRAGVALLVLAAVGLPGCRKPAPYEASRAAAELDRQLDWSAARLIAVQDGGRYKTLDTFARESFASLSGREHLPGLSPCASLVEWLFNRDAYLDTPLVAVRSAGVRARVVRGLSEEKRQRIEQSKRFTPRELADPAVQRILGELEAQPLLRKAVGRVRMAQAVADRLEQFVAIVPQPGGDAVAAWLTPRQLLACLSDEQLRSLGLRWEDLPEDVRAAPGRVPPDVALEGLLAWSSLWGAWGRHDAAGVQAALDDLARFLPTYAAAGVYPVHDQRVAEARYYAAGKFTGGWVVYFIGLLLGVAALVTGWRNPWIAAYVLLVAGLAFHVYGISLRWFILGRIPVANMFEAVVAAAAMGILVALVLELVYGTRVLLLAAHATGFAALVTAQFVLPGSELGVIPGILDDVQLRLHTVMIIAAYALIFKAAVIAVAYLIGYVAVQVRGAAATSAAPAGLLDYSPQRPLLAGGAPGDEGRGSNLPAWLNALDWTHLIVLNMAFVLLFVGGLVLGAWWADYSWGRPWGWDAKEVFALNTWVIYAILIHVRFVVRNRGLWTACLSIAGCLMMAFNWFCVNFWIASIHSYA